MTEDKMVDALLQLLEEDAYVRTPRNPAAVTEMLKNVIGRPEYEGVTVAYPGNLQFRLARAGGENLRFGNALAEAAKPYYLAIAGGALSEAGALRLLAETYATAVVLEWEGGDLPKSGDKPALAEWLEAHEVEFDDIRAIAEDSQNFAGKGRTYGDAETVSKADGSPGEEGGRGRRAGSPDGSPRPRQAPSPIDPSGHGAGPVELAGGDQLSEPRNGKPLKRGRRNRKGRKRHRRSPTR